jgi:hypothetical protein
MICLRCGCPVIEGEAKQRWKSYLTPEEFLTFAGLLPHFGMLPDGHYDLHATNDQCLVALRRKEVESITNKTSVSDTSMT